MPNKDEFDKMFQYAAVKEKNKWLIHIKTEIIEPGLTFDITEHKIYYDSVEGNFRRKLQCECGAPLACFCFRSLEGALESVDGNVAICPRCWLKDPESGAVEDIMAELYPDKTVDQMNDIEISEIMKIAADAGEFDYEYDIDIEACKV